MPTPKKPLLKKQSKTSAIKAKSPSPKKKETPKKAPKLAIPSKPFTQSQFFSTLAEQSGLPKKDIQSLLGSMRAIFKAHLGKGGPEKFTLPGILKMSMKLKAATPAKKGRNPATGEEILIKAKPARKILKIKALKKFSAEL